MTQNNLEPLITIGITCFNAQDNIINAMNSAIEQSWDNTEIIIIDDCSTDNSATIIQNYIKNYTHAKLIIQHKNQGASAARQKIIEEATGEFIAFFDDDDVSDAARLQTQYRTIIEYEKMSNTDMIACYASGRRLYPNGYEVALNAIGSRPVIPHGPAVADRLLFFGQTPHFFFGSGTPTCSLMARKSTFISVGGFDPAFRRVEDIDFAIRLALKDGHFIGTTAPLFTQNATQGIDKAPEKNCEAEIALAHKHQGYLKSIGYYYYAQNWPKVRYYHFKQKYFSMMVVLLKLFVRYPIKTTKHFLTTAPKRFLHELKMKTKPNKDNS